MAARVGTTPPLRHAGRPVSCTRCRAYSELGDVEADEACQRVLALHGHSRNVPRGMVGSYPGSLIVLAAAALGGAVAIWRIRHSRRVALLSVGAQQGTQAPRPGHERER